MDGSSVVRQPRVATCMKYGRPGTLGSPWRLGVLPGSVTSVEGPHGPPATVSGPYEGQGPNPCPKPGRDMNPVLGERPQGDPRGRLDVSRVVADFPAVAEVSVGTSQAG